MDDPFKPIIEYLNVLQGSTRKIRAIDGVVEVVLLLIRRAE
jgi:hypothetical protein